MRRRTCELDWANCRSLVVPAPRATSLISSPFTHSALCVSPPYFLPILLLRCWTHGRRIQIICEPVASHNWSASRIPPHFGNNCDGSFSQSRGAFEQIQS